MNQRPVLRRCVTCRQLLDRQQLWRVIRDHQEGVVLDEGMGRSAYLCTNEACLEEALRRKRLQKALRCQVPNSVVEVLQKRLNHSFDSAAEAK
ncbi:MAG: YlxR family protein [Cyanobacteriota bacterium]|nr:YlxR family protein [Cyanobacteriota bacterium]